MYGLLPQAFHASFPNKVGLELTWACCSTFSVRLVGSSHGERVYVEAGALHTEENGSFSHR